MIDAASCANNFVNCLGIFISTVELIRKRMSLIKIVHCAREDIADHPFYSATFSMERAMNGSYLVCSEQTKVFTKQKLKENTWVFISGEINSSIFRLKI
jgi:hypothetical protein